MFPSVLIILRSYRTPLRHTFIVYKNIDGLLNMLNFVLKMSVGVIKCLWVL